MTDALATTPTIPSLELFSLKGQTALITGGSRGIGAAIAIALAQAGANIIIAQRDESHTITRDAIRALPGRKAEILKCDLSDLDEVKTVFESAVGIAEGGRVHILVNCGGMLIREDAVNVEFDDWTKVINVNLNSLWILCQAAGRHMIPSRHGKIINVASLNSYFGGARVPSYSASKGAVTQLTKALSNEWSRYNINVNAIAPGSIATDINATARKDETFYKARLSGTPGNRWGEPEDFAGPAVFLASAASQFMCGEIMAVDGGATAKGPL
ncbi:MAG: reductase [Tremellales sp. Tagirdzhanova-0007]|nr:MAG: reductase [Tremellales sp. Tagirdzhanova-0007]